MLRMKALDVILGGHRLVAQGGPTSLGYKILPSG